MPTLRQQAHDLARQLRDLIAEARFWQQQAEQRLAADDRRQREAATTTRQNMLTAAARQRQTAIDAAVGQQQTSLTSLTTHRDQELAAALAAYTAVLDPLPAKINTLTQGLGYAARPWDDAAGWDAWQPVASLHAPAALRIGQVVPSCKIVS